MQVGPIYDDELAKQLVRPLPEGARLHCFVDACKGVFALGPALAHLHPRRRLVRLGGQRCPSCKALLGQRA